MKNSAKITKQITMQNTLHAKALPQTMHRLNPIKYWVGISCLLLSANAYAQTTAETNQAKLSEAEIAQLKADAEFDKVNFTAGGREGALGYKVNFTAGGREGALGDSKLTSQAPARRLKVADATPATANSKINISP
ncbi:MAG: hypothetical protein ABL859_00415, partial [Methylotenera sp.]